MAVSIPNQYRIEFDDENDRALKISRVTAGRRPRKFAMLRCCCGVTRIDLRVI